jgi:hypothetical protein
MLFFAKYQLPPSWRKLDAMPVVAVPVVGSTVPMLL